MRHIEVYYYNQPRTFKADLTNVNIQPFFLRNKTSQRWKLREKK